MYFLSVRIEPTLDHNSAFRQIRLSDGYRKATLCAENQSYPDHPDRFVYWRQVMCVEPLAGSPYYWEVEWTGQRVTDYSNIIIHKSLMLKVHSNYCLYWEKKKKLNHKVYFYFFAHSINKYS